MSENKEVKQELKLHLFLDKADPQVAAGMLKMFYHAAYTNKIGMSDIDGQLYIVGVGDTLEDGSTEYFPLARVLETSEADALTNG